MGKGKKIGAYITLDGAKTFQSDVTSCNKELRTLQSELKLVEAQNIGNANSTESLSSKQDVLIRVLEKQQEKLEKTKEGLEHLKKEHESVGNVLEEHKNGLNAAKQALEEMSAATDVSESALEKQRAEIEKEADAVDMLEEAYRKAGDKVNDWQTKVNNATAQVMRATAAVNENSMYLQDAKENISGHTDKLDEFGNKTDDVVEKLTQFKTILKTKVSESVIDESAQIIKKLYNSAVDGAIELQDAQAQLQASTGATRLETEKYTKEMQELYSKGYADSIDEVANAMELVKQYTNETDPDKIRELAENGIALEDVFGIGLNESVRAADVMIQEMGLDAREAFDLLSKGAQNGLNKSGELADNIAEYGPLWAQAGFSAEEMFSIMQNGLDSGAYNLDKVNDYVKEFGNSLADGRIETHLTSFSKETQQVFEDWKQGNASTKQVFTSVIKDLSQMENKQKALTIASDTWSATGEDNSLRVLTSLNDVNDMYSNVQGTMENIKTIKYDTISNEFNKLSRKFQQDIGFPIIEKALPIAEKTIGFIGDNLELTTGIVVTFGTIVGTSFAVKKIQEFGLTLKTVQTAFKSLIGIGTAKNAVDAAATTVTTANTAATVVQTGAVTAQATATTSAAAAQTGLNAAMSANPVGLLITGMTVLVGTIVACALATEDAMTEMGEFSEATEELTDEMKKADIELQKTLGNMDESLSEIKAQENFANDLIGELYSLDAQANKTDEQIVEMTMIVRELNELFPDLSLSINENTGELSKNEAQVKKSTAASLNYAKAQAAQEQMADVITKMTEAEIKLYEAKDNIANAETKLNEIQEERIRLQEELNKKFEENSYTEAQSAEIVAEHNEQLNRLSWDEQQLESALKEQKATREELNNTLSEAQKEYESIEKYVQSLNDTTEENSECVQGNTEAVKQNTDAKKEQTEETKYSIEIAGQEKDAYDALSASKRTMAVEVTNAVLSMREQVTDALESQMNLFEEFDKGTTISKDKLLSNMQSQITGIEDWEKNLSELAKKGINEGLLQELMSMGPEGASYVEAFNSMSSEELKKAGKLWKKSLNIQSMTNDWGEQLLESGAANVAGGVNKLNALMEDAGADTVGGLVLGMQAAQETATTAGTDLGVKTIDAINEGLGCASPSKKTKTSGKNTGVGLVLGVKESYKAVEASGHEMGNVLVGGINDAITEGEAVILETLSHVCDNAILKVANKFKVDFSGVNGSRATGILSDSDYSLMKQAWIEAAKQTVFKVYLGEREVTRQLSKMGVVFNA